MNGNERDLLLLNDEIDGKPFSRTPIMDDSGNSSSSTYPTAGDEIENPTAVNMNNRLSFQDQDAEPPKDHDITENADGNKEPSKSTEHIEIHDDSSSGSGSDVVEVSGPEKRTGYNGRMIMTSRPPTSHSMHLTAPNRQESIFAGYGVDSDMTYLNRTNDQLAGNNFGATYVPGGGFNPTQIVDGGEHFPRPWGATSTAQGMHSNTMYQNTFQPQLKYENNLHSHSNIAGARLYHGKFSPFGQPDFIEIPMGHTPTWGFILPKDYGNHMAHENMQHPPHAYNHPIRRRLTLSLINVWEFTIAFETMAQGQQNNFAGLRAQIKKISRGHQGQGGRKGAIFERGPAGDSIVPDDPLLKQASSASRPKSSEGGKWRIPLGAYHALITYLTQDGKNIVEGIPPEQLRAATLERERMDRKDFPEVHDLIRRGVSPGVAGALAPYQRGGVDFILDKKGRALLADEMGLGKTVQAIAAMSAFSRDWPLLVLCPSSARYHWESEFQHWMGKKMTLKSRKNEVDFGHGPTDTFEKLCREKSALKKEQINVLTSGKVSILPRRDTMVVICSLGLIVALVNSGKIAPGMFRAVIVDESHALKSKSTKRTKSVLPLLRVANRCLLLSGTPALARPSELWPQLSVLGSRRSDQAEDSARGIWEDEAEFMSKYVKIDEPGTNARLAELHTLLTSTVMIRRMKADILKSLPPKIREKAFVRVSDENLRDEFRTYMQILRRGKGVLGKLAREHLSNTDVVPSQLHPKVDEANSKRRKEVLHHLYKITGKSKILRVTKMLNSWLSDPTKGKLCIFAHHLDVLDSIARGAKLSNSNKSSKKFIRIDGSTSPKARQHQILQFQTDPTIRVALLGITAAGVAVTLTASSTVWFAELFWTPAIMIQAEDRCHRIGQQARVRCLYFVGRETLDEVLWKLIEKKFRDLGEFVEGKENMDIALERELEDEEEDEILKSDDSKAPNKRKAECNFSDLVDSDDVDLKEEIAELCHEEEKMLKTRCDDDDEESEIAVGRCSTDKVKQIETSIAGSTEMSPICLSDEEHEQEVGEKQTDTIAQIREIYRERGILARIKLETGVRFNNLQLYTVRYPGPTYGLIMVQFNGRVIVKSFHATRANSQWAKPEVGSIIVALNGIPLPYNAPFNKVLKLMKEMMRTPPVVVTFAEDPDFMCMFIEDVIPTLPIMRSAEKSNNDTKESAKEISNGCLAPRAGESPPSSSTRQHLGIIELLDDE